LEQSDRAVAVGLAFLRELGIEWSPHPTLADVAREYDRIEESLGARSIESLIDLPEMEDPIQRTIVDLLAALEEPAFFTDENLRSLMVARMVNISLVNGNTDGSCIAYVHLGWFLAPRFGDYEAGFRFGKLGLELVERPGLQRFRARVLQCFGYFINPCSAHLRAGIPLLRRSFGLAQEAGDLTYAGYCCDRLVTLLLAAGENLEDIETVAEEGLAFVDKLGFHHLTGILVGQLRLVQCLRASALNAFSFDDGDFNERSFEQTLQNDPHLVFVRNWYWIRKLQALFYEGNYEAAVAAASNVEPLMQMAPSFFEAFEVHFYAALARAAIIDRPSTPEALASYELISAHLQQLQAWTAKSPENFADRAALVSAELARLSGRVAEAMESYEQAIRLAHSNGFLPNEGIAYELAARFYARNGFERFARLYFAEARHCYSRWGARRKVEHLDALYPNLRQTRAPVSGGVLINASLAELDLSAALRASQAVSGEIVLDSLIQTLLRIVVEHAGAQRGLLILFDENVPRIEAEAAVVQKSVVVHLRPPTTGSPALPESILHYVIRTHKNVILDDAAVGNLFSEDVYIRRIRPRSIFCLPLLKQSRLIGVLYLENNLAVGVFTPSRQGMLELLASQAAISLENARLYTDLGRLNDALRTSEQLLQGIVDNTSATIFVKDLDLRYVLVNREYERRHRVQRDQVRGKTDFDVFPPEIAEVLRVNDRQVIEGGKTIEFEEAVPGEKGVSHYFSVKFLLRSATGQPYAVCGIATDITERRRAEEAVRDAQSALAHITRVMTIGELTASIAHELNQPLTGIVTNGNACLRWLGSSPPNLDEARQAVNRIVRDGRRAADVITRIRALVRKTKTEMVPLNLNDALQEVVLLVQAELRKNLVRLQLNLEGAAIQVVGDRVQLQQVILNLLVNAIEAVTGLEDLERRTVCISSHEHESDQVLFSVRDTGVGLAPESLETIFGAFVTTKPQGMGMGLAISRSIIENHGGRLWAENNPDHGVTFSFTLPKSPPTSDLRPLNTKV
jgi:PAS domain S-box-containing protein